MKKQTVMTTTVTQTGNETLGKESKILYYLIIGDKPEQVIINVGEKTYNSITKLTEEKGTIKK